MSRGKLRHAVHAFEKGAILIHEDEPPQGMFILVEGRLSVHKRGRHVVDITAPGSFVGELSWLLGTRRLAEVRAETDGQLIEIEDIQRFFSEDAERALAVARLLAKRLDEMDRKFLDLAHRLEEAQGAPAAESSEAEEKQATWRI